MNEHSRAHTSFFIKDHRNFCRERFSRKVSDVFFLSRILFFFAAVTYNVGVVLTSKLVQKPHHITQFVF